jgi:flavin reductase (DIM6/NTAB) family NADH-FMN oxidoreductase RutF
MDKGKALQKLTNGYYILTARKPADELKTREEDYIAAGIINWASQVSFEPLQVGVSVQADSHLNETIDYSEQFTLHVLSDQQIEWIEKFGGDSEITDAHINGVPYSVSDGWIRLEGALVSIDCTLANTARCGDHTLHVGEVARARVSDESKPLTTQERASAYQGKKPG